MVLKDGLGHVSVLFPNFIDTQYVLENCTRDRSEFTKLQTLGPEESCPSELTTLSTLAGPAGDLSVLQRQIDFPILLQCHTVVVPTVLRRCVVDGVPAVTP